MTATKRRFDRRVEPDVGIGDVDPMSVSAYRARVTLCSRKAGCTRAAGHDEGEPSTRHVRAPKGIVEWVT